ncbi:protein adenylyltransferase SelO [Shewanella sp. TC10]|uniref:protein adenylyltransferase SelO n=1 Tax=Shewanella sp. TC10 TaxID=1419739 RepID=UPI001E298F47|nr:protein adenylyltransferase SelO family protein [Shewanella sp. TC10]
MKNSHASKNKPTITTLHDLASFADYSFMDKLNPDPQSREDGNDFEPRQVFSGHYVPVKPTPIRNPEYVSHSQNLFIELGLNDCLATSSDFMKLFSGDMSQVPAPMRKVGWSTGYALSIYGTEYIQQCPFQTGNGYGDGRAISILEAVINGQRWEMQLKGGGRTPYCRGADGRAVLRSSIREFLAQEHMHALGVPTSRSLSLYVSKTDKVQRPWYSENSHSENPDRLISEPVAISTRVAPSFIRVGQLELFGRRVRHQAHDNAIQELEKIVLHLIEREYADVIDLKLPLPDKIILLAKEFRNRLTTLIANWIRIGFCQGNFNSDNCAAGGYTLDYGPFGFCDVFDPQYQPWTGGGLHFSFMNQPNAAQKNFDSFCSALRPLLSSKHEYSKQLDEVQEEFSNVMHTQMNNMWAVKLGLEQLNTVNHQQVYNSMLSELETLMKQTKVDYTIFFRELSSIPDDITALQKSFYDDLSSCTDEQILNERWNNWLADWKTLINISINESNSNQSVTRAQSIQEISTQMKLVNPKYILREWFVVPAYQQAASGNYSLLKELQQVMTQPYDELTKDIEEKYYQLKPTKFFEIGGLSHLSCSS